MKRAKPQTSKTQFGVARSAEGGFRDVRVLLHNIRSTHNVGSIFRTADAGGVSHIYISGYTPTPTDQFNRKRKDIAKVALGAEDCVAWSKVKTVKSLIAQLKIDGFSVIALEQSDTSVDYKDVKLGEKVLLVVGNEVKGMSSELLKLADVVAEIPMEGEKESLNVSVAFGIALFRLRNI